jgi:hypothetical protein
MVVQKDIISKYKKVLNGFINLPENASTFIEPVHIRSLFECDPVVTA